MAESLFGLPAEPGPPPRSLPKLANSSDGFSQQVGGVWAVGFGIACIISVVVFVAGGPGRALFVAAGTGVGAAAGAYILRRHRRLHDGRQYIYEHGDATTAVVTKSAPFSPKLGVSRIHEVEWRFELDGATYEGKRFSDGLGLDQLELGQAIWVVYDPEDPSKSAEWPPM